MLTNAREVQRQWLLQSQMREEMLSVIWKWMAGMGYNILQGTVKTKEQLDKENRNRFSMLSRIIENTLSQNELLTYLWYLNLRCTLRGLGVI